MFTKFAKAEILGVRTSSSRVKGASLQRFAKIGKETTDYRLQDGYIYTKVRAISSRVNKNNDGWPAEELAKAYSTFVGKPIFVDHNNSDPSRARGVIIDARLHVEDDLQKASALDPYYATAPDNHKPPTWIELLLETDAREFPKLAKAIISGDIDSVSMGANVERTQCNICSNWASSPEEYCDHIHSKGAEFDFVSSTGERTSRRSYEDCYDIGFFEISYVFDPADETALVLDKISKTAAEKEDAVSKVNTVPPESVRNNARRGLKYYQEGKAGDGFEAATADRAKKIAAGEALTSEHINRMHSFFERHAGGRSKKAKPGEVTAWDVAWLCWGGDSGRTWAAKVDAQLHKAEHPNSKGKHSGNKIAQKPQVDLERSPEEVDTLRQEKVCDLCGNTMENGKCDVCGYEQPEDSLVNDHQPPESLSDPNIDQAQENIQQRQGEPGMEVPGGVPTNRAPAPGLPEPFESRPGAPGASGLNLQSTVKDRESANINSEWTIVKNGGLITRVEKPILPPTRITSDKVVNPKPISKPKTPVESKNKENTFMSNREKLDSALEQLNEYLAAKTAAEPTWNDPNEQEADLTAVGGEMTGDPEKDTKQEALIQSPGQDMVAPDTQTFPDKNQENPVSSEAGSAGQGPIGVAASVSDDDDKDDDDKDEKEDKSEDKKEDKMPPFLKKKDKEEKESRTKQAMLPDDFDPMERADMEEVNYDSFDGGEEIGLDSFDEENAILDRIREEWGEEVVAALEQMSSDDLLEIAEGKMDHMESDLEMEEHEMGEADMEHEALEPAHMARKKSADAGIVAPGAEAEERVSVDAPLLEETGPETNTFGSDSFHITQPITQDGNGNQVGGPIGQAMSKSEIKSHIFRAMKVAEVEVSLGLTPEENKYERAAELEDETPAELKVREETLANVKKANLSKPSAKKVAGRVPSLKTAGVIHSHVEPNSTEIEDSALFS